MRERGTAVHLQDWENEKSRLQAFLIQNLKINKNFSPKLTNIRVQRKSFKHGLGAAE